MPSRNANVLVSQLECAVPCAAKRRCAVDEAYFDVIGPTQAYWLGYLLADGCVAVRRLPGRKPQVALTMSINDARAAAIIRSVYQDAPADARLDRKYRLAVTLGIVTEDVSCR
jgi:hypothetical protein